VNGAWIGDSTAVTMSGISQWKKPFLQWNVNGTGVVSGLNGAHVRSSKVNFKAGVNEFVFAVRNFHMHDSGSVEISVKLTPVKLTPSTGCVGTHLERSECHRNKAAEHAKNSGFHKSKLRDHAEAAISHKQNKKQNIKDKNRLLKLAEDAEAQAEVHNNKSKNHTEKAEADFKEYEKQTGLAKTELVKAKSWSAQSDKFNADAGKHSENAAEAKEKAKASWESFKHHLKQAKIHEAKRAHHAEKEIHHLGKHFTSAYMHSMAY
jgi:hypothetical protein